MYKIFHYFNRYGHFSPARIYSSVHVLHTRPGCAGSRTGIQSIVNGIIEIRSSSHIVVIWLRGLCVLSHSGLSVHFVCIYVESTSLTAHTAAALLSLLLHVRLLYVHMHVRFLIFLLRAEMPRRSFEIPEENVII